MKFGEFISKTIEKMLNLTVLGLSFASILILFRFGIIMFCLSWVLIGLLLVYKEWDGIMNTIIIIEYKIFGKPLDKKNWSKGELKRWHRSKNK